MLLAGRTWDAAGAQVSGLLWAVSLTDGKRLWELPLAAPPVYDGLALGESGAFVSLQNGKLVRFNAGE